MDGEPASMMIPERDPVAVALRLAVHAGDLDAIARLLGEQPGLARARFVAPDGGSGTALHMVADWPGYFPNGPAVVELLIGAGADPNYVAGPDGGFAETPLHAAASSDDADVAAALIDGGGQPRSPGRVHRRRHAADQRRGIRLLAGGMAAGGAGRPHRQPDGGGRARGPAAGG
jgi:hypothetical protein